MNINENELTTLAKKAAYLRNRDFPNMDYFIIIPDGTYKEGLDAPYTHATAIDIYGNVTRIKKPQ